MSACSSCGFANPEDRDFCPKCGSYTRWDPTVHVAAVKPSAPEGEQKAPDEPEAPPPIVTGVPAAVADSVIVTVRKPGDDAADTPVELTLAPGAQASLVVTVRNQSGIVDNYDLECAACPRTGGRSRRRRSTSSRTARPAAPTSRRSTLRLHPPRSPEAEARAWPIEVVARSRARGEDAGAATATVTLEPYDEIESELRPEIASGRRGAEFAIAVRNVANAPVDDRRRRARQRERLPLRLRQAAAERRAGPPRRHAVPRQAAQADDLRAHQGAPLHASPRRRSAATSRPARSPASSGSGPGSRPGCCRIVPILIAAGVAVWALRPNNTKVPDLTGAKRLRRPAEARRRRASSSARSSRRRPRGPGRHDPQHDPDGRARSVNKGKEVIVLLAVGTSKVKVPIADRADVPGGRRAPHKAGLQVGRADAAVRRSGQGDRRRTRRPSRAPRPPRAAASTSPSTRRPRRRASRPRRPRRPTRRAPGRTPPPPPGDDGGTPRRRRPARPTVMPALAGPPRAPPSTRWARASRRSRSETYSDDVPAGKVISVDPPEGTKLQPGQKVDAHRLARARRRRSPSRATARSAS